MSLAMRSNNPAFQGTIWEDWATQERRSTTMTVQGTAIKTFALLGIVALTAAWSWTAAAEESMRFPLIIGGSLLGTITAFVTIFKKSWAPVTAPLYAALEGVFLGALSSLIETRYKGIAFQAVSLTICTAAVMAFVYATRLIRVTDKLATGIIAATGAVALLYLVSMVVSMFGGSLPFIHSAGPIGIAFSLFVVGLAAFNLLLDYDFIERSAAAGAPKSMEWYGAFGLVVTLVWLYLEVLRLLRKFQDNR